MVGGEGRRPSEFSSTGRNATEEATSRQHSLVRVSVAPSSPSPHFLFISPPFIRYPALTHNNGNALVTPMGCDCPWEAMTTYSLMADILQHLFKSTRRAPRPSTREDHRPVQAVVSLQGTKRDYTGPGSQPSAGT
ncbi:hypothetical protein EVAR_55280_1 [Eumeta japonica]|uniref:Uncharacterized protein n=1 Tax=Eumeta variegata TaxID=151549 RepID=A0A4C1ZGT2_EUMVA|nr:hypothetical protein EVAR_55280_1 [Eumeta japonica]